MINLSYPLKGGDKYGIPVLVPTSDNSILILQAVSLKGGDKNDVVPVPVSVPAFVI